MPDIIVTEPSDFSLDARQLLEQTGTLVWGPFTRNELKANMQHATALFIRLSHQIDEDLLDHASELKYIASPTTGLNHIDQTACAKRQIKIICLKGEVDFLKEIYATAEHTWGLLLALIRHIPQAAHSCRDGFWDREKFKGTELHDKTIGIIGLGRLGEKIAVYAHAFGMKVIAHDPFTTSNLATMVSLDELAQKSDIISVHASYSQNTHHLLNDRFFQRMKREALLVNTARGEIIDEQALINALDNGILSGAALDVLEDEHTLTSQNPSTRLQNYAHKYPQLLITPHIGGATYNSMAKTEIFIAQKLANAMRMDRS